MNRRRRGESVFLQNQDYSIFVELLKEVVDMYNFWGTWFSNYTSIFSRLWALAIAAVVTTNWRAVSARERPNLLFVNTSLPKSNATWYLLWPHFP